MYTTVILVIISGLVILFAFEVRHSETTEEIKKLKHSAAKIDEEIIRLKAQMKMKKDAYEEHKPTMLYPPNQSIV
jgi:hypothetical protein